jgi:hypothetical protein
MLINVTEIEANDLFYPQAFNPCNMADVVDGIRHEEAFARECEERRLRRGIR